MSDKNINYGWVCPLCGKANAPWNRDCSCVVKDSISITSADRVVLDALKPNGPITSPCDPLVKPYEVTCNG